MLFKTETHILKLNMADNFISKCKFSHFHQRFNAVYLNNDQLNLIL